MADEGTRRALPLIVDRISIFGFSQAYGRGETAVNELAKRTWRIAELPIIVGALVVLMQSAGCGQFFRASSAITSPEGRAYVFSTKDAYVCEVTETDGPVCAKTSQKCLPVDGNRPPCMSAKTSRQ